MNSLSENIKNYLIVTNSTDYLQQIYGLCLDKLKHGSLIVLITSEFFDFSDILGEKDNNKDQLKNFIIMYYNTFDDISEKLLLLHSWSLLPHLVVVDLSQLLRASQSLTGATSASLMQKVTLCTVSLLAYLQSIAVTQSRNAYAGNTRPMATGLLILRSNIDNFGDAQIQTLKDLYFYKTDLYQDFVAIRSLLLQECG